MVQEERFKLAQFPCSKEVEKEQRSLERETVQIRWWKYQLEGYSRAVEPSDAAADSQLLGWWSLVTCEVPMVAKVSFTLESQRR